MKKGLQILIGMAFLFIIGELILRMGLGFTDAVLVREDAEMEYIALPNQERKRFGNAIYYNEYSMRSDDLLSNSIKILGLGDSVLNGGVLIDQQDLVTALLTRQLSGETERPVQVLNISYKSWGPDNSLAFLKKYGDFNSEMVFLVASSHDATDIMKFDPVVGRNVNYPVKQYSVAYFELMDRYVLPKFRKWKKTDRTTPAFLHSSKREHRFNSGFSGLLRFTQERNIPFIIYLHPELSEVHNERYNRQGQAIIDFANSHNIPLVQGLDGANQSHYRDNIHLNKEGHQYLFDVLLPVIRLYLSPPEPSYLTGEFP